jgi:threonine/homoserine/homoserine lactone efflux protein
MVGVSANFGEDKHAVVLFFIGTLGAIVSSDMLKVFIADKLKKYLKPQLLVRVNHIVGILLMASGVYLIIRVILRF